LIRSRLFGEIDIEEEKVLTFPSGLIGMKGLKRFIILDTEENKPFRWMQSLDDPGIAFLTIEPRIFRPDYCVCVHSDEIEHLGISESGDVLVLCIVTVRREPRVLTANLQGPLVINAENRFGKQLILMEGGYSTRHPILEELNRSGGGPVESGGKVLVVKSGKE